MGRRVEFNQSRTLRLPRRFDNLDDSDFLTRLNRALLTIEEGINEDRFIEKVPIPSGFAAANLAGGALLRWDGLDSSFANSLWGARIWRAPVALVGDTILAFRDNRDRRVLVDLALVTSWFDPAPGGADFVYWVQWVDKYGRRSSATPGLIPE